MPKIKSKNKENQKKEPPAPSNLPHLTYLNLPHITYLTNTRQHHNPYPKEKQKKKKRQKQKQVK
jgi:hypothetical protein